MATKAQLEGNKRHQEKLDRMVYYAPKGSKDKIKARAQEKGLSLNAYVVGLIENDIGELCKKEEDA